MVVKKSKKKETESLVIEKEKGRIWLVGLDQALMSTGVAVLSIDLEIESGVIFTGVLNTNRKEKIEDRLSLIDIEIEELLFNIKPQRVGLEQVYPGLSGRTVAILCQVYSTVTNVCNRKKIKFTSYSSCKGKKNSWVSKVGLKGTKELCKEWLVEEKGDIIEKLEEHEIDAIGILFAVMVDHGIEKNTLRYIDIQKMSSYTLLKKEINLWHSKLHLTQD